MNTVGWRMDIGKPIHLWRDCIPARSQPHLKSVHIGHTLDGKMVLIDELTKHPVFVQPCKRCMARGGWAA